MCFFFILRVIRSADVDNNDYNPLFSIFGIGMGTHVMKQQFKWV